MALQGSGAISLGDIQTEFGGSNPISISEYYGVDTGVPGSGTISLSDFYGTSNTDVTPDALYSGVVGLGPGNDSATDTVTGINQTITIRVGNFVNSGTVRARVNTNSFTTVFSTSDFSVSNNDTFTVEFIDVLQSGISTFNGSIQLTNETDGSALLKSFSVSTFDSGGGGL
jgi:hypothetical protein